MKILVLIEKIKTFLINNYGWEYPGAKYMDDLFQSLMDYVLLRKFNIDRRKIHYLQELEIKNLPPSSCKIIEKNY